MQNLDGSELRRVGLTHPLTDEIEQAFQPGFALARGNGE